MFQCFRLIYHEQFVMTTRQTPMWENNKVIYNKLLDFKKIIIIIIVVTVSYPHCYIQQWLTWHSANKIIFLLLCQSFIFITTGQQRRFAT